jgi:hypothetical protein
VAPIKFGLDEIYAPTVGARPPFLAPPPHVFVLLIIDATFLADFDPFIKTIVYNIKIKKYFINRK